jgi:hypothetical protein
MLLTRSEGAHLCPRVEHWKGCVQSSAILLSLFIFIYNFFLAFVFWVSNLPCPPFRVQVGVPSAQFVSPAVAILIAILFALAVQGSGHLNLLQNRDRRN